MHFSLCDGIWKCYTSYERSLLFLSNVESHLVGLCNPCPPLPPGTSNWRFCGWIMMKFVPHVRVVYSSLALCCFGLSEKALLGDTEIGFRCAVREVVVLLCSDIAYGQKAVKGTM